MKIMKSEITRDEWEKYILDLFFGNNEALLNCINRAYRDFNRTLHGYGSLANNEEITRKIKFILKNEFKEVKNKNIDNQNKFDEWHQSLCNLLIEFYNQNNYKKFYIGQAQKWINMTFKYIFAYGNKYINGYDFLYQYCHVPIDNILIEELKPHNPPKLLTAWSRIDNYAVYLKYQQWFHKEFKKIPLDIEFKLWKGEHV